MRRIRSARLQIMAICFVLVFAVGTPAQIVINPDEDQTPPVVVGFVFDQTSIDTSTQAQQVSMTVHATDDLSGVSYISMQLTPDSNSQPRNAQWVYCYASTLQSGTRTDGYFTGSCYFPQYSQSGTWSASYIYAQDRVTRIATWYGTNAAALGDSISVTSTEKASVSPPIIETIVIQNSKVDVSSRGSSLPVQVQIYSPDRDFYYLSACATSPNTMQQLCQTLYYQQGELYNGTLVSGTRNDGLYQFSLSVPQYAQSGVWHLTSAFAEDASSEYTSYYSQNYTSGLTYGYDSVTKITTPLQTPFDPTVMVIDPYEDVLPPDLGNLDFTPRTVDVSLADADIAVTLDASDSPAGFRYAYMLLYSPRDDEYVYAYKAPADPMTLHIPRYSEQGNWHIMWIYLVDNLGNYQYYYPSDLQSMGFPGSVQVSMGLVVYDVSAGPGGTVTLKAKLTRSGQPLEGKTIDFYVGGNLAGTAVTDAAGVATLAQVTIPATYGPGIYANAIGAQFSGDDQYAKVTGSATLTVTNKLDQQITFDAIPNQPLSKGSLTLSATASSGLVVSYLSSGSCIVSGSTLAFTGAGQCSVTAKQLGNQEYNAALQVVQTFSIYAKSDQTITFSALPDKHYGDGSFEVSASASSGLLVNFSANGNCSVSGSFVTLSNAGTCSVTASQGGNESYNPAPDVTRSFQILLAPLTISADDKTAILKGAFPGFTATYSGFVLSDGPSSLSGTLSCTTAAKMGSPVGSYSITCSGQSSSNYAIKYVPGTLRIQYAPAELMCLGERGHTILQPINADGTSVRQQGSTIPVKFRVCDKNGNSIGTAGVITKFQLVQMIPGTVTASFETAPANTNKLGFRWDVTAGQWIFNLSTATQSAGWTYVYEIDLNDGTAITFRYGLR
jgi:hypothetical protein